MTNFTCDPFGLRAVQLKLTEPAQSALLLQQCFSAGSHVFCCESVLGHNLGTWSGRAKAVNPNDVAFLANVLPPAQRSSGLDCNLRYSRGQYTRLVFDRLLFENAPTREAHHAGSDTVLGEKLRSIERGPDFRTRAHENHLRVSNILQNVCALTDTAIDIVF